MLQQYGSSVQMSVAHASHDFFSLTPLAQIECEHDPLELDPDPDPDPDPEPDPLPLLHDSPQIDPTSPTQIESHAVEQQ